MWMCLSVLTFGLVLLIYLIGKLKQSSNAPAPYIKSPSPAAMFPFAKKETEAPVIDFSPPSNRASDFQATAPVPTAVSPDVITDRLDTMVQRLGDMQNMLLRQANQPTPAGLPPETIDKLLKIIGNVVQQIDVLQKNMGAAPTASTVMGSAPAAVPPPMSVPPIAQTPPAPSKMVIEHTHTPTPKPVTPAAMPAAPAPMTPPLSVPKPMPAPAPAPAAAPKPTTPPGPAKGPGFGPSFGRPVIRPPEPGKPA